MKKNNVIRIMALMLTIVIFAATLIGCSDNHDDIINDPDNTESISDSQQDDSQKDEVLKTDGFLAVPASGKEIESYRAEVTRRLAEMNKDENANFVTEAEEAYLEANGYNIPGRGMQLDHYSNTYAELSTYYFPIMYKNEKSVQLWCMTEYGELRLEAIDGKLSDGFSSDYLGNVNYTTVGDEEIIRNFEDVSVVYDASSGKVSFWSLGEKLSEHNVPENSVYAGFSYWEGYIFRSGTDVYAVRDYGIYSNKERETLVIAHNVKFVIDADYAMGSDDWSQPLFLMTDGSIKGYCTWRGDKDAPADDVSYLYEVPYEGSYDKK